MNNFPHGNLECLSPCWCTSFVKHSTLTLSGWCFPYYLESEGSNCYSCSEPGPWPCRTAPFGHCQGRNLVKYPEKWPLGWPDNHFNDLHFKTSLETNIQLTRFKWNADHAAEQLLIFANFWSVGCWTGSKTRTWATSDTTPCVAAVRKQHRVQSTRSGVRSCFVLALQHLGSWFAHVVTCSTVRYRHP